MSARTGQPQQGHDAHARTPQHGTHARTGLARAVEDTTLLGPGRIALCSNYTSVTADLTRGVDALLAVGAPLHCLLTPEHGYWGSAQAGESEGGGVDETTGLPVLDTYRVQGEALDALLQRSGAERVVVDLQDIGTRFYTYLWTLFDVLVSASRVGLPVTVLDRPNPLGRAVHGPGLRSSEASSFVGRVDVPLQHGLTLGELARWFATEHVPAATGAAPDLTVVAVTGWDGSRARPTDPWVMPSPNMPTLHTALLYPATGLLEGTEVSEGRGTTRPFELLGAPWTDGRLHGALRELTLPGLAVREAVFSPTFSPGQGQRIHGVQLHITDPDALDPILTGHAVLSTLARLYPEQTLWRAPVDGRPHFIDLLWGSSALREGVDDGASLKEILAASPAQPVPPDTVRRA